MERIATQIPFSFFLFFFFWKTNVFSFRGFNEISPTITLGIFNQRATSEREKKDTYSKRRGEWNVNSARFQPYNWPRGKYHKLIRSICKSRYGAASRIPHTFYRRCYAIRSWINFHPPLCRTGARDSDFSTSINRENRNILLSAGLHRIIEFFNGDVRSDDTRGRKIFLFFFFSLFPLW